MPKQDKLPQDRAKPTADEDRLRQEMCSRVAAMRKKKGWTLEQLSAMAGVSKAMLSQIEQHKVNPTVAVMIKIASAMRLDLAELIASAAQPNILRVIPASDSTYTYRSDPACTIRTLSPLSLEKSIEFYRLELEAGGILSSEPHYPGTQEFLHVAKGKLAIGSGDQTATASAGDSVHYRADQPHRIRNVGRGRAEAYMIVHYRADSAG